MQNEPSILDGKMGVVTVTYNSSNVLPDFFASLDRQTYRNFIVYAIDNCSTDDSVAMLEHYAGARLKLIANEKNAGVAAGNNEGILAALKDGCETVLLLNNDVAFEADLFLRLLDGLVDNACSMVVPLIYFYDFPDTIWTAGGGFQRWLCYRNYHRSEGEKDNCQYTKPFKIDYASTCCVLIRREAFETIGLMDERFFVYSDDVDFMYRALHSGLSMFVIPSAKLWHKVHTLTGGSISDFTLFYGSRGRSLFLYKHFNRVVAWFWTLCYVVFCLVRPLFGRDTWRRAFVRIKGTRDGKRVALT